MNSKLNWNSISTNLTSVTSFCRVYRNKWMNTVKNILINIRAKSY